MTSARPSRAKDSPSAPSASRRFSRRRASPACRTPRVLDESIALRHYEGPLRQIAVADLGHEEPALLLTNQLRRSPSKLVERYARRMLIENNSSSNDIHSTRCQEYDLTVAPRT